VVCASDAIHFRKWSVHSFEYLQRAARHLRAIVSEGEKALICFREVRDHLPRDRHWLARFGGSTRNGRFTKYGSDPTIVGKRIRVDNELYTIAAALPKGFRGLTDGVDLWMPLSTMNADDLSSRWLRWLQVVARMKPGITVPQARAEMDGSASSLRSHPHAPTASVALR